MTTGKNYFLFFIFYFSLLLLFTAGVSADFSRSGNIVTDNLTRLQWQDDTIGTTVNWQGAIDRCENLSLDGFRDWRLPNLNELTSLVSDSRVIPAINPIFQQVKSELYRSSTNWSGTESYAWNVDFWTGYQRKDVNKDVLLRVRCVRAGE